MRPRRSHLFDTSVFQTPSEAIEFIENVLESSTEYSIIGKDLDGTIVLWNEGARRLYGYSPDEVIGKANSEILHTPEDVAAGIHREAMATALEKGTWTSTIERVRKDGKRFTANVVITRRVDSSGKPVGFLLISKDISDELRLTHELEASQFYTRSLIESNIDALMTTDPVGVISDVNDQMTALTGVGREELIGTPFKNYFTAPDVAEDGIRQVLREGKVTNYELTARASDGHETVVSYNASTFHDRDGRLQGVFAAARDVTEHKKLEQQLREAESYNRGLIESSVDGLIAVDPDGFISDVNDRMCTMTGYTRDELLGSPFAGYFTDAEAARAGIKRTLEEGFVTEYALTLVSRSRRELRVSFNASVFHGDDDDVKGIFASARDITDRVRLEDQLLEQQTYLRGLIEASIDGLVTVDPEGFVTDVNDQFCRMTGCDRDELIGSEFKGYFTEPARAETGVKLTFADGAVTNYELVLKSSTGRKATVSFNASVFRAGDGTVQGIFASARDISEQARLQAELAQQQAYTRSLIEASADALFAIAPDGMVTDVNEEATRLTGYTRPALVNSRFSDYFTDHRLAQAGVERTLDESRVLGYDLVLVTRHGRKVAVSFNAGVFTDAFGEPRGILASARETTAQRALEEQARDSQFYTRSLIESNIDALMTTDPVGVISDVNEQMVALTGVGREELIGTPFKNYFTDPDMAEDGIRLVLREGKVNDYELTARASDGRETVVSYNASTFHDRDGRLQGVFAAARDVTERRRFEEELKEKNIELERANASKDLFLANMSHELRTPLNAIIGFTGTLLMRLPGPLNDEQEKQLSTVQSNGRHLLSIINDLLDLAKIESGTIESEVVDVRPAEVAEEVLESLRPAADAKGLTLELDTAGHDPVVRADRRALHQILLNLVNNGVKFTEQGSVRIELGTRLENGDGIVRIAVVDSGIGIRPADRERLFRAFEQLDQASARRFEGTGLGLYISKKLVDLLGGTIGYETSRTHGSTFYVELPEKHA